MTAVILLILGIALTEHATPPVGSDPQSESAPMLSYWIRLRQNGGAEPGSFVRCIRWMRQFASRASRGENHRFLRVFQTRGRLRRSAWLLASERCELRRFR